MKLVTKSMRPFNPDLTFESGQCFRWEKHENIWRGIAERRYAEISGVYPNTSICCEERHYSFWENYFDSKYDYETASKVLEKDKKITDAVINNKGVILLRQPFFETLISFIISANNNIPRIKTIVNNISVKYGTELEFGFSFPKPETLASLHEVDLLAQNCGYRSKYIIKTAQMICEGYAHDKLKYMALDDARDDLCKFMGVGKKVADCILIYSLGRKDAYPVDTWIRKASHDYFGGNMTDDEIRKNAQERFGKDAALAQQYMFVSERAK